MTLKWPTHEDELKGQGWSSTASNRCSRYGLASILLSYVYRNKNHAEYVSSFRQKEHWLPS